MRHEPTEAEARLWRHLRNRQLAGVKFVRQHVIGSTIPDFVARSAKLIIEVDGDTHSDQARDERRSALLQKQGFRVIRFSNLDVMSNVDGVCNAIIVALGAAPHQFRVNSAPRCSDHAGSVVGPKLPLPAGERER